MRVVLTCSRLIYLAQPFVFFLMNRLLQLTYTSRYQERLHRAELAPRQSSESKSNKEHLTQ